MRISTYLLGGALALGTMLSAGPIAAGDDTQAPDAAASAATSDARWKVWGGRAGFRWNTGLLADLGIQLREHDRLGDSKREDGRSEYALRDASALDFDVLNGNFAGFTGGALAFRGGVDLVSAKGAVSLRDMRLVPRKGDRFVLDVIGNDGTAWLFVDRMMYQVEGGKMPVLEIRTMDLRIAPAFARLLGDKGLAGLSIADMAMTTRIHSDSGDPAVFRAKGGSSKWPGMPVPGQPGEFYLADVFMHDFDIEYKRRRTGTDGPGGADGGVVFAPSSTLRNNRNNGTPQPTFPSFTPRAVGGPLPASDPLGTSTALHAADVPWNSKFSANEAPYGNDQHPFLIWNLIRIDADGRVDQIARSGVKHAWLTTNFPCDESTGNNQILGRGCADTYSDGNNDAINDLGPRSELVPAAGLWGRCGSVYDGNCDGVRDSFLPAPCATGGPAGCQEYAYRMEVQESDIDPTLNPGATYYFESWYIVRDDINIYNTMQSRPVTFAWSSNIWSINNGVNANLRLGPAIDRWVAHDTVDPDQRSTDLVNDGGHARIAVNVVDLGGGSFRYDYAVMNLDFARATTSGSEPNLRVLSNDGFTEFALPVSAALAIDAFEFSDGDTNPDNDWVGEAEGNRLVWRAPVGESNPLNWGTMYRFSITTQSPPIEAVAFLTTARVAPIEELEAVTLVPQSEAVATFTVGGELSGLAAGQSVSLQLNGGAPLELDTNDVFGFTNEVLEGGAYAVTVATQPATQTCGVANGEGTIDGADINDVLVTCVDLPPPVYSVSGSVAGLDAGRSVTLQLNGDETLVQSGNGDFEFISLLGDEAAYNVTAAADGPDRICIVNNGSGFIADADVTGVQVVCDAAPTYTIGGAVSGLASGASVSLQLNAGQVLVRAGDGPFVFGAELLDGAGFDVVITAQPAGMFCEIAGGSGNVNGIDVDTVAVTCVELSSHTVGGTLSGMPSGRSIALRLNGGPAMVLSSSRSFTFIQTVFDGSDYSVTVSSSPTDYECSVANGAGTIDGADVDDVAVTCVSLTPGMLVYGDGFE